MLVLEVSMLQLFETATLPAVPIYFVFNPTNLRPESQKRVMINLSAKLMSMSYIRTNSMKVQYLSVGSLLKLEIRLRG